MLHTLLVFTLSLCVASPALARSGQLSLLEMAGNGGRAAAVRVFDDPGTLLLAATTADREIRLRGQDSEEAQCVADAHQQHDEAILHACESPDAERCENAKRTNAATLRVKILQCRESPSGNGEGDGTLSHKEEVDRLKNAKMRNHIIVGVMVTVGALAAAAVMQLFGLW